MTDAKNGMSTDEHGWTRVKARLALGTPTASMHVNTERPARYVKDLLDLVPFCFYLRSSAFICGQTRFFSAEGTQP
jgi:hypothetical protein